MMVVVIWQVQAGLQHLSAERPVAELYAGALRLNAVRRYWRLSPHHFPQPRHSFLDFCTLFTHHRESTDSSNARCCSLLLHLLDLRVRTSLGLTCSTYRRD